MNIAAHIKAALELPDFVVKSYLEDLSDDELLVRPFDSMNHIAWQLGHLIAGEHSHINQVIHDSMPSLPEGFAEKHTKATASADDRSAFYSKSEYLNLMDEQRSGTLAVLSTLSDEELSQPSPESIRYFGPTIGSVFAGESAHWDDARRSMGRCPTQARPTATFLDVDLDLALQTPSPLEI